MPITVRPVGAKGAGSPGGDEPGRVRDAQSGEVVKRDQRISDIHMPVHTRL